MNNSSQLQQAKEIIANLKVWKENKESSSEFNNHLSKNVNIDIQCDIRSDILHKYNSSEEATSNKYKEIKNIINDLRETKEQKFNDVISVAAITTNRAKQDTCDTFNFANVSTNKSIENALNDSGEIVSKASVNYLKKSNNKRSKLKHSSNSKQLPLTEFYNIVKSIGYNDANNEYASEFQSKRIISSSLSPAKAENQVEKSELQQKSLVLNNSTTDSNNSVYIPVTIKKDFTPKLQKSNSNFKEKGAWDIFNNVKKNNETNTNLEKVAPQKFKPPNRVHIQKEQCLKEVVSKNPSEITLDDFWNNIITDGKLQNCKLNPSNDSSSKENRFVKSFSVGNTISEKENSKDTNSVPLTNYELTNVRKRLEGNITFDDFIESALRNINNKNTIDYTQSEEAKLCNKLQNYDSEETIISVSSSKQSNCNREMQKGSPHSYSDYDKKKVKTTFILIDEQKKLQKHNFIPVSQDMDTFWSQHIYNCTESEINESTSQINQPNLRLENEINKTKDKAFQKTKSTEEFCNCISNCIQNEVKNDLESQISSLDNGLEKSILTAAYRKKKAREESEENTEPCSLEFFLENRLLKSEKKTPPSCKYNLKIKRYRKGKTRIYKLRRLKKRYQETEQANEDLNFHDLLKKMTTESLHSRPRFSRFKSGSSISTSSSYITDDAKLEVLSTGSGELSSPQQRLRIGFNELSKDETLLYSANEWEDKSEHDKEDIKTKIQAIFFQVLEDFKNKKGSCFRHKRQSLDNCIFKDGRLQFKPDTESSMTVISSRAQKSKAKFQLMLHILKKIQTLLETGTKLTKRELYYQLKGLISDQGTTNRSINAISCLLDVGMWALNIIAQKGLVFGDLKLLLSSGEVLNCNIPGTLIPRDINDIAEVHSTAYFILVVEKESIFHKLIEEDLPNKLTRPFIMITGKGFPDLNTQLFIRKLWMVMSIPVFILVDADPHGINIMLNYRFGSVNNAHVSQHLAVPKAKWLGVYPSEITNLNITREPLNEREIKMVNHMLTTPYMEFSPKLVEELQVLLTKKYKAGIEGLMKTDSYLSEVYLPNKFFTHNFI